MMMIGKGRPINHPRIPYLIFPVRSAFSNDMSRLLVLNEFVTSAAPMAVVMPLRQKYFRTGELRSFGTTFASDRMLGSIWAS